MQNVPVSESFVEGMEVRNTINHRNAAMMGAPCLSGELVDSADDGWDHIEYNPKASQVQQPIAQAIIPAG